MYIDTLALNNFRNYNDEFIKFSKGINIIYGDNAQGKTNILEAIYMLATTKSHRGSHDKEIINFNSDEGHIKAEINKKDINHRIDIHLRKNKNKGIAIDMVTIRKSAELFGLLNIIIFAPEDLNIIKSGPSERRKFVDMGLCQLSRVYYSILSNYNKILNQRNNLLKQIYFDKNAIDMLDIWDEQLVGYGNKIIQERRIFVEELNTIIPEIHKKLTSDKEQLRVIYDANVNKESFKEELLNKRDIDIRYQTTQIGPQRDDLIFEIDGRDVKKYGSQGQVRTVALSLKLAEIELVKRLTNDNPILLLDDVMSELDKTRRDSLLNSINDIQTIITCTGYDDFIKERLSIDKIYNVSDGKVHLTT